MAVAVVGLARVALTPVGRFGRRVNRFVHRLAGHPADHGANHRSDGGADGSGHRADGRARGAACRRAHAGAIYALALGSNFGACTLTLSASLAGLLWRAIFRQKGVRVRAREFLRLNLTISAVAMGVGCAVLVGQVYVEYR